MATKLEISQLDFDGIKDNLKTFLSQQDEFTDYDFEGSGMNVLLDVLAYNTHYLGYNANMLANEMYLDSADQRASVVSLAKQVGAGVNAITKSIADIQKDLYAIQDENEVNEILPSINIKIQKSYEKYANSTDQQAPFKFEKEFIAEIKEKLLFPDALDKKSLNLSSKLVLICSLMKSLGAKT